MPDLTFYRSVQTLTTAQACEMIGADLRTSDFFDHRLKDVASLEARHDQAVVFVDDKNALGAFEDEVAFGLCLTSNALFDRVPQIGAIAVVDHPRLAFAKVANALHSEITSDEMGGVSSEAIIDASARIHQTAFIGAGARIGAGVQIGAYCVIGPGVEIGADCVIEPSVTIACARIGARVRVKSGARLGQKGFGFIPTPQGLYPAPQLGCLVVGNDVEVGANTTIDRGALGDTTIGDGVKIDNQVQIGHNVIIGNHCVIAAQSGISGSVRIGAGVALGGQVGMADHITIGDGAQIAAKSGLMRDVPAGEKWGGIPARPVRRWMREVAALGKLASAKK